jgi:hypothetical protein
MRRCVVLAVTVAIALPIFCLIASAQAEAGIPCENFTKNADGSWTVRETTYIEGPDVKVQEHALVQPGRMVLGHDIAAMIAKACPNATVALPSDETPNLAPGSAPRMAPGGAPNVAPPAPPALAKYADANGNIDVRQLTCAHLNAASPEEAQLLLAWYSGWYKGLVKARGINLARIRYTSRSVVDYCRTNSDKRLTDVMELMLK